MATQRCAFCGESFQPRPQTPLQAFCSAPACQRARKRKWQRDKLNSDPDYRINQRAAQQAWTRRHPDYWRHYRCDRPTYAQRNRDRQRARDGNARLAQSGGLAKMDACSLPNGLYRITQHTVFPRKNGGSLVVEITPLCAECPCKMDASREDVIDGTTIQP